MGTGHLPIINSTSTPPPKPHHRGLTPTLAQDDTMGALSLTPRIVADLVWPNGDTHVTINGGGRLGTIGPTVIDGQFDAKR